MATISAQPVEEFRVLFADKSLLRLQLIGGVQTATADEIVSFVADALQLGEDARNMFAIWIMSPSLELQLKPSHIVFHALNHWVDLLKKHGETYSEDSDQIWSAGGFADEIPVVVFRRNVFYPIERERIMLCRPDFPREARRLLYAEAAENILCGRVVSGDTDKYHELAGLRATIEFGRYNEETHTDEFYEERLHLLYPEQVVGWNSASSGSSVIKYLATGPCAAAFRRKFVDHARTYHRDVTSGPYAYPTEADCHQRYLSICSELPTYASAFYSAKLRVLGRLWGYNDVSVVVAINGYGVCVLSENDMSLLTALSYRCVTPIIDKASNSLHLKFTTRQGRPQVNTPSHSREFVLIRDLHLISKQVSLMNALINTFSMLHDTKIRHSTTVQPREAVSLKAVPTLSGSLTPGTPHETSLREQQFWSNKYKSLRLPSFRKESDL